MNNEYYVNLLDQFKDNLMNKEPYLAKKKVLFRQDNPEGISGLFDIVKFNDWAINPP